MTGAMVETLIAEKLTEQTDNGAMTWGISTHDSEWKNAMSGRDNEHFAAIRRRAYEISQQPDSGSEGENWARAERELTRGRSTQTEGERALGPHEEAD